jgi:hypothetical protein
VNKEIRVTDTKHRSSSHSHNESHHNINPNTRTSLGPRLVENTKATLTAADGIAALDHGLGTAISAAVFDAPAQDRDGNGGARAGKGGRGGGSGCAHGVVVVVVVVVVVGIAVREEGIQLGR